MNIKLPGNKLLLLACVLLLLIGAFWVLLLQSYKVHFESNSIKISKIIARVEGAPLSELDLENYTQAQKLTSQNSILIPGLVGLKRLTAMQSEAHKKNIYPKQSEVDSRIKEEIKKTGQKESADLKRAVEMELVKEKMLDNLTYWREAEFLDLRFDVLPKRVEDSQISGYQQEARNVLDTVKDRFDAGESLKKLRETILEVDAVKKDFAPNAVQFSEVSTDRLTRQTQRYVKISIPSKQTSSGASSGGSREPVRQPSGLELHVLEMKSPRSSDLWCAEDACFLIRVLNGSDGKYANFEGWLKEKGL